MYGWRWVIDPLDGTRNYLTAAGPWSVCLALQFGDVTQVAVVHDPAAGETFSAARGSGATLGGEPMGVRTAPGWTRGHRRAELQPVPVAKRRMATCVGLLPVVGDVRRLPAALDLCFLAAGRLDGAVCLAPACGTSPPACSSPRKPAPPSAASTGRHAAELAIGATPGVWPELAALTDAGLAH